MKARYISVGGMSNRRSSRQDAMIVGRYEVPGEQSKAGVRPVRDEMIVARYEVPGND
jgi:hypothetical protein